MSTSTTTSSTSYNDGLQMISTGGAGGAEHSDGRSSCETGSSSSDAYDEDNNRIRIAVYNLHKQIRIYHVGVLVRGKEFHYGVKIGVFTCEPANRGKHFHVRHFNVFRWNMKFLRHVDVVWKKRPLYTNMSMEQLLAVQEELRPRYTWARYNPINHNCMDYAMEFIRRIVADPLPPGKFFAWAQELRQPLIVMPLRLVCATEAWKSVMKLVEEDEAKKEAKRAERRRKREGKRKSKKCQEQRSQEEIEKALRRKANIADEEEERKEEAPKSVKAVDIAEDQQQHSHPHLYITTIKILPREEIRL